MSDVLGTIAQGVNPLQMANQVMQFRNQQQQLAQNQFALQQAKLQPAYAGLNALLEKGDALTWGDIPDALAGSERLGADISGLTQNANEMMAKGMKPQDFIRQYGTARYVPPFEAAGLFLPQPSSMHTAYGTVYGTTGAPGSQAPGAFTPQGLIGQGLSPTERMEPMTVMINGQLKNLTRGQVYDAMMGGGMGTLGGGGGAPAASSGLPKEQFLSNVMQRESGGQNIPNRQGPGGTPASSASGLYQIIDSTWAEGKALAGIDPNQYPTAMSAPPEVQHQVASALYDKYGETPWAESAPGVPRPYQVAGTGPVVAPGGASQPGGGIVGPGGYPTLPQPGAAELATGAAGRAQGLVASQNSVLNSRAILEGMLRDIATPGFISGAGNTSFQTLRQVLMNFGITPENMEVQSGQSANEQFQKFVSQLDQQTMGALGNPTDARQELAAHSNPSQLLSKGGNTAIIRMLMGNLQAIDVMSREFQNSGTGPANFDTWRSQFTAKDPQTQGRFDPRVFWMANMPPDEQKKYWGGERPDAQKELSNNLQYAKNRGWIAQNSDGSIGNNW